MSNRKNQASPITMRQHARGQTTKTRATTTITSQPTASPTSATGFTSNLGLFHKIPGPTWVPRAAQRRTASSLQKLILTRRPQRSLSCILGWKKSTSIRVSTYQFKCMNLPSSTFDLYVDLMQITGTRFQIISTLPCCLLFRMIIPLVLLAQPPTPYMKSTCIHDPPLFLFFFFFCVSRDRDLHWRSA